MKTHEILPERLWIRGRSNDRSLSDLRATADDLRLRLVVAVCPKPDWRWPELPGVSYWHRPFPDSKVPTIAEPLADDIVNADCRTLIYCNAGRNRSAYIAALVLMRIQGIPGAEAAYLVQQRRPGSLANTNFMRDLLLQPGHQVSPCIRGAL